jgi:hypothetical protein
LMGKEAFITPLAHPPSGNYNEPPRAACMFFDPAKVKSTRYFHHVPRQREKPYVSMQLGYVKGRGGGPIWEYAHRFILWAMLGPPAGGLDWGSAVVNHYICQDGTCVHPLHMRWSTQAENLALARGPLLPQEHDDPNN